MTSVLLGIQDPQLDREARTLLNELPEFSLVGAASNPAEIVQAAIERNPTVVVLSAPSGSTAGVLDLARQLGRALPHVAVVLAVRDAGPTAFADALRVGARGLVAVPLTLEDLRARMVEASEWSTSVQRLLARGGSRAQSERAGRTVVVAGAKGGVGTTTVAVHVALACAESGARVCLIDFDLQTGDVGAMLGITHSRTVADLVGAGEVTGRMIEETAFPHASGLRVLLCPVEGEQGEDITAALARQVLGAAQTRFDVLVVDVGSQTSEAGAGAVEVADDVLVVSSLDLLSILGARRLARLWARVHARKEDDLQVVFNLASRRNQVQPEAARRVVRLRSAKTVLPADFRALEAAVNEADPARVEDKAMRRAFESLAQELGLARPVPASTNGRRRRAARADGGQAAVEFVGVLPIFLTVALLLWQFVLVGFTWMLAGNAADDAGRRLAVHDTDLRIRSAALDEVPSGWHDGARVDISRPRSAVSVTLRTPLLAPGFVDLPVSFTSRVVVPPEPR